MDAVQARGVVGKSGVLTADFLDPGSSTWKHPPSLLQLGSDGRYSSVRTPGIELPQETTMPDQPDDPIHYDMKIPPEPKDTTLHKAEQGSDEHRGSDEVTHESNDLENPPDRGSDTPATRRDSR